MKIHPKTQKINCTVLKKNIGGACPRTPLAIRMASTCKFPNLKKTILGLPLPSQILGTPLFSFTIKEI